MSLEGKIFEFEGFILDVDDKTVYLNVQKVNI